MVVVECCSISRVNTSALAVGNGALILLNVQGGADTARQIVKIKSYSNAYNAIGRYQYGDTRLGRDATGAVTGTQLIHRSIR